MADNPIRKVAEYVAAALEENHEALFGYVPDETDPTKPNKIYYPSRPESPLAKEYLAIEITRFGVAPAVGPDGQVELTLKFRTDLTEREWTDGGHTAWADLGWNLARLINAAAWRYKVFSVGTVDYETVPNDAEPTEVGFNLAVVLATVVGSI